MAAGGRVAGRTVVARAALAVAGDRDLRGRAVDELDAGGHVVGARDVQRERLGHRLGVGRERQHEAASTKASVARPATVRRGAAKRGPCK